MRGRSGAHIAFLQEPEDEGIVNLEVGKTRSHRARDAQARGATQEPQQQGSKQLIMGERI